MSEDKQGLPFRLFDSVLGRMKKLVDGGADVAREGVRIGGTRTPEAGAAGETTGGGPAPATGTDAAAGGDAGVLTTPRPSETATAAPALATALDEEAKAAIAEHAGEDGAVTDGLAIKDQSGRVAPDEELGPEPFTPQVGP